MFEENAFNNRFGVLLIEKMWRNFTLCLSDADTGLDSVKQIDGWPSVV